MASAGQFTPDLMPSDILGSEVLQDDPQTGERRFKFVKGPSSRTSCWPTRSTVRPKTQAALLEAMAEKRVSAGTEDFGSIRPFSCLRLRTRSSKREPIHCGKQLDRFLYKIMVDYPVRDEEIQIVKQISSDTNLKPEPVMSREQVLAAQGVVRQVVVSDAVIGYATDLIQRPVSVRVGSELSKRYPGGLDQGRA